MSPKRVDKEQRKREIARIALNLFAERGFESTSISQIAGAAGIGKGSIYEYFESKEDLVFRSILAWMEMLEQDTSRILAGIDDPVQRLRAFVHRSMDAFLSDDRTVRVGIAMFQMLLSNKESYGKLHITREMFRGFRSAIVDILRDGVTRGVFRPGVAQNAEKIAINLTAYLDGIGLHHYLDKGYCNLTEQVDLFMDRLLEDLMIRQTD